MESLAPREFGLQMRSVLLRTIAAVLRAGAEEPRDFDVASELGSCCSCCSLEVNFLLQRIENFHGIAILTTNLDGSIDPAFRRRLAAHVVFQHPDEHERAQLWRRMVTADAAPLGRDIDERALARHVLATELR